MNRHLHHPHNRAERLAIKAKKDSVRQFKHTRGEVRNEPADQEAANGLVAELLQEEIGSNQT